MVKEYKDWLFVKVPKDATEPQLANGNGLFVFFETKPIGTATRIQLPSGSYQIIGKGDAIDWDGIVDVRKGMAIRPYFGYVDYGSDVAVCLTATESGHSLLRSLEMEPETTLILKKNEK